jgi:hypothetical protein
LNNPFPCTIDSSVVIHFRRPQRVEIGYRPAPAMAGALVLHRTK